MTNPEDTPVLIGLDRGSPERDWTAEVEYHLIDGRFIVVNVYRYRTTIEGDALTSTE